MPVHDWGVHVNVQIAKARERVRKAERELRSAQEQLDNWEQEKRDAQEECDSCMDCSMCIG